MKLLRIVDGETGIDQLCAFFPSPKTPWPMQIMSKKFFRFFEILSFNFGLTRILLGLKPNI